MQEPLVHWDKSDNRKGIFGDYTVMAFKYRHADQIGWHVSSWKTGFDPVHDYWVSGQNFHAVSIHYFYRGTPETLVQIYEPPITEGIEPTERNAVLEAVAQWEKLAKASSSSAD
jgi:hypothetical protein